MSFIISIVENLLVVLPALLVVAFVTVAERKTMASMQRRLGPVWWLGKSSSWVELSNSGDPLKLMIPNYYRKVVSGWSNYSGMVISHKIYENIMGYRGSKSDISSVKEQRVYGSWHNKCLRYTLMDFERNYQIKIPSNQINKLRYYSTYTNIQNSNNLDPNFLTGFADAESSFIVLVLKEPKSKTGWTVKPRFAIGLHKKDIYILELIKSHLGGAGNILKQGKDGVQYRIGSLREISKILIPFFDKYPLLTNKKADFILFKQIIDILNNKEHLTIEGIRKILTYKSSLNLGLSDDLKKVFPNIISVPRPLVENQKILDPNWLAGFTSGEGCFSLRLKNSPRYKLGYQVMLTFKFTQHIRDKELLESIINYLNCGFTYSNLNDIQYTVFKFEDIFNKIIPFFDKYNIIGVKSLDYQDFKKASLLIKNKEHLTSKGIDLLLDIRNNMNKKRDIN